MVTTKKKTKPKKVAGVSVVSKPRKKNAPRTAYSKEHPSPHAFQPGVSGNPGGKARLVDAHLSRSLRIVLADRAPDAVAEAMNLPKGASWSMCLARKLVYMAVKGDLMALREIRESTEGSRISADFKFPEAGETSPLIELVFVSSDGDGHPAPGSIIEAKSAALPELPDVSD
ncbi:MAG: DUF5681 domain-containing protein [Terracidiphilus sp.]